MSTAHHQRELKVKCDWLDLSDSSQTSRILKIAGLTDSAPHSTGQLCWQLHRGHLVLVARLNRVVVGYLVYAALHAGRRIVSIAVDPGFQRRGIGTRLIGCLKRRMSEVAYLTDLEALVPERQLTAQQFFRANQFRWMETIDGDADDGLYVMRFIRCPTPPHAPTPGLWQTSPPDSV